MSIIIRGWTLSGAVSVLHDNWSALGTSDSGWCGTARSLFCFFLPLTPCRPPRPEVIEARIPIYDHDGYCGIGAGFLPAADQQHGLFHNSSQRTDEIRVDGKLLQGHAQSLPSAASALGADWDAYRIQTPLGGGSFPDQYAIFKNAQLLGFINRPNLRFKLLYETLLADFMAHHGNPSFGSVVLDPARHTPCAAIHVRHGDKLTELARGTFVEDRATFNHSGLEFVAKAKAMGDWYGVDIRTIFVMTDDLEVIDDLNRAHDDIRFLYVDSHRQKASDLLSGALHDVLGNLAGKDAAISFATLFLAVQLASRCEYLVVNTGSAISELLLSFACLNQESCPKVYDFRRVA